MHKLHLRWTRVARVAAVIALLTMAVALLLSYRNQGGGFLRRSGGSASIRRLSQRLVSSSEGIHRFDLHGDKARFLLNAARDDVFDDGHHEMREVTLEVYGALGITQGQVKAAFAIYDPGRASVSFEQGVEATTTDGLWLKTDRLEYDGNNQVISTLSPVEFARENMRGYAVGVEIATRRGSEQVTLREQVRMTIEPRSQSPAPPRLQPILARCGRARYRLDDSVVHFSDEVVLTQSGEELIAERMEAHFDQARRLRRLVASERAALVSRLEERVTDIHARGMEFILDEHQRLSQAVGTGAAQATRHGGGQEARLNAERIEVRFVAQDQGAAQLLPTHLKGDGGRVEVRLRSMERSAGKSSPSSAAAANSPSEKELTADSVELSFRGHTRELEAARARGNAVLVLTPLIVGRTSDRKTIRAQAMELRFYEGGNLARSFHASDGVRVEFEPLTPEGGRAARVTTSQELRGEIDQHSQEFTEMEQWGRFRYAEGERNALCERAVYTSATMVIRLTGGEPVVWDSRSRTRAREIELNHDLQESRAFGNVTTTYYDRKAAGQALPFLERGSPIFLAADQLIVNTRSGLAVYSGNAKTWQDDNYVSADRIEVHRQGQTMTANGKVRSALYRAAPVTGSADARGSPPAFATAQRMTYLDADRMVRYEGEAQLRQESQRISADMITGFLEHDQAELERALADGHVLITEPGRKAFGDSAVYSAASRAVTLRGANARVEDDRNGVTRGPQLTFILGDGRVAAGDERGSRPVKSTRKVE